MARNGQEGHNLSTFSLSKSCPIHFGPLKDAKSLPCGHAFCFNCLKPYSSNNRVVCPLCNTVHRVDIYLLPSNQSLTSLGPYLLGALPASADEYMTKSKALSTQNSLKNAESACEMAMELLDSIKDDFRDMKSSFERKRQSISDELEQFEQNNGSQMSDEEKAAESRTLATACDVLQRVCAMAKDRAFDKILQVSKAVEDVSHQVKSIGLCRYYVYSEGELEEALEKKIISVLASLIQRSSDHTSLCESMVAVFPNMFSSEYEGAWTAIVGDSSLVWNVPSCLLVQGRTSKMNMVVYCSQHKGKEAPTHKLGMLVSQVRFKSIIECEYRKDGKSSDQELISRISKRVNEEFGGKWHCIAGNTGKFVIKATGVRSFLLKEEYDEKEYTCWKYHLDATAGDGDKQ